MTQPPIAPIDPTIRRHHGDDVVDNYEWLRDKKSERTIEYLRAENEYVAQQTAHLQDLRETIFGEIKSRTQETDMSVPTRHGSWWYYARTIEGEQYGLHCRCPIKAANDWEPPALNVSADIAGEEILLDSNREADGHDYFSLGALTVSHDGRLMAYSIDTAGDERYTLRVKDLLTGEVLRDEITGVSHGATWSLDGSHLFYATVDDAWRPNKIWRHRIGSGQQDTLVYEETDERFFVGVGSTSSEKYLVIGSSSKVTSEVRVLDSTRPDGEFEIVIGRRDGVEYSLDHAILDGRDFFLVLHNDNAPNFELICVPVSAPTDKTVVIRHRDDTRLEDIDVFAGQVMVSLRRDALARVAVMRIVDGQLQDPVEIDLGEELFTCGVGANAEWDQPLVRLGFTSFVTPTSIFDYVVESGELLIRKQAMVLGDFDASNYQQHRLWAKAPDGTHVPISMVSRRDTPRDGSAPALIYGYGSYEASMDPSFGISRLSLLDRGFVYAVAHVRGGGEMGRKWYDDGKLLNKRNTFTDFIACAEQLVNDGWTTPQRLVAEGGSAGGLLMGAVANLAPQAFAGIVANVPFVDALTSILDPSLPLTVIEWDEWGDPLHDANAYHYMKSYSPYENVIPQDYPPILAITSLNDTRVLYVEPAKWIARLRATKTGTSPVLLKTEMNAGHGGVSGRYASWHERAYELAWIIDIATRN